MLSREQLCSAMKPLRPMLLAASAAAAALLLSACGSLQPRLTSLDVDAFAADVTGSIARSSPPLVGMLDADAAVLRAIEANREIEASRFAAAIEQAQVRVDGGQLLPDILAETDYYRRDKRGYSHSNLSNVYATSSDLATLTHNIDLSLNLLDFGLTLIRMRQGEDRAHLKEEETRRVALRIAEDTRGAYWRTVALQTLVPALVKLAPRVNEALSMSQRAAQDAALDPVNFINFQRDLLNTRRELNDVFSQLAGAEYQLRNLANIEISAELTLDPRRDAASLPLPKSSSAEDIAAALRQRPEMRQAMYTARITDQEVTASILKVLPGATLTETFRSDSTSFLLYGNWTSFSARIAANLMDAIRLPRTLGAIEAQQDFDHSNAMVTASAIAMQVCAARAKLAVQFSIYRDADEFARSQGALLRQVRNSVLAGKLPEQMIAREELSTLLAQVRAIVAFGELQSAYAAYQAALGASLHGKVAEFNE